MKNRKETIKMLTGMIICVVGIYLAFIGVQKVVEAFKK